MIPDHPSDVPPFAIGGVIFHCRIAGGCYEWRSDDGICSAGKNIGNAMHWGRYGHRLVGQHFVSLKGAMQAVAKVHEKATRAA